MRLSVEHTGNIQSLSIADPGKLVLHIAHDCIQSMARRLPLACLLRRTTDYHPAAAERERERGTPGTRGARVSTSADMCATQLKLELRARLVQALAQSPGGILSNSPTVTGAIITSPALVTRYSLFFAGSMFHTPSR